MTGLTDCYIRPELLIAVYQIDIFNEKSVPSEEQFQSIKDIKNQNIAIDISDRLVSQPDLILE